MQGVGIFCDLIELLSVKYGLEVFIFIGIFIKVGVPGYTNEDNYVLVPYNFDASVYNLVSRFKKNGVCHFQTAKPFGVLENRYAPNIPFGVPENGYSPNISNSFSLLH